MKRGKKRRDAQKNKERKKKEETDEMMWRHSVNSFRKRALTPQG